MTAYNFFLRDQHLKTTKELEEKAKNDSADGEKKKVEPRTKAEFQRLSKEFGQRWKSIESGELAKYKKLAEEDTARYHREMEEFYKDEISALCMGSNEGDASGGTGNIAGAASNNPDLSLFAGANMGASPSTLR